SRGPAPGFETAAYPYVPYPSATHSQTFPLMSQRAYPLRGRVHTGWVLPSELPATQATAPASCEPAYSYASPPRAAYSHSASVGNRYDAPVLADSRRANSVASSQDTCSTGQSSQSAKYDGEVPITSPHIRWVTSLSMR